MSIEVFFAPAPGIGPSERNAVLTCRKMVNYLDRLAALEAAGTVRVNSIRVRDVSIFGNGTVGYIYVESDVVHADTGDRIPGLALLRGDSVAILPVFRSDVTGEEYTATVRQARLAIGVVDFEEIPAGMIDEGCFVSKALDELSEELGADIGFREEDLTELETFHSSPGGCDESIRLFAGTLTLPHKFIESLAGRGTGSRFENERIIVNVFPLTDLPHRAIADGKTRMAYYALMAKRRQVAEPIATNRDTPSVAPC